MALLEIKNLAFTYSGANETALKDVNFSVESGDFVVLCGETGCGKTTLLKLMKKELMPHGDKTGGIYFEGTDINDLGDKISATKIGFVMQDPNSQIVTDKVWHELAFGLESLGEKTPIMRRKIAEIASYFGITDWYRKNTNELSGGQKQILNLASILVMQPKLVLLDEPTSQLDPITASNFIQTLAKLNKELGITIIIVEHRLEEVFSVVNKAIVMEKGQVLYYDIPQNVGQSLKNHRMGLAMPSSVRIFNELDGNDVCPLTVKEGRNFLQKHFLNYAETLEIKSEEIQTREVAIEIKEGFFRYERSLPDVLNGVSLEVYNNEFLCILGGNGTGKTTLLNVFNGKNKIYSGKLRIWGKKIKEYFKNKLYENNVVTLPQNPKTMFVKNTVYSDLLNLCKLIDYDKKTAEIEIKRFAERLEIDQYYETHPYDLSGGEQQKLAFIKVLLMRPKILLLDEFTKGMDAHSKKEIATILRELKEEGITIVMVTHDIEFAAEHADRCALFFDGGIVSVENRIPFFANNNYYTTAARRITKDFYQNTITVDMAVQLAKINGTKENEVF